MKPSQCILKLVQVTMPILGAALALGFLLLFFASQNIQAASLRSPGGDPEIRHITMTSDLPHYDPTGGNGITKTVYFSNSRSGIITMTFEISGTPALTLTALAAFDASERTYTTSTDARWPQPVTYYISNTHTTQPNILYTASNTNSVQTTMMITYVQDITAPTSVISYPVAGQYVSGTRLVITGIAQDNIAGSGVQWVQVTTGTTWVSTTGINSWVYTWTLPASTDGQAYTLSVRAQDHLNTWQQVLSTASITVDNMPPTDVVITAPTYISATQFVVSWSAKDRLGVSYTVQYSTSGSWYTLLTNTVKTSDTFAATPEADYVFRVTAFDRVGNSASNQARTHTGLFRLCLPVVLRDYAPFTDGSFEADLSGWKKVEAGLPVNVVESVQERPSGSTPPADGAKTVLLGNTGLACAGVPIGYAAVEQTFIVPESVMTLTFSYIIWTQDASPSGAYDRFEVYVDGQLKFSDGNQVNQGLGCGTWRRVPGPENQRGGATSGWAIGKIDLTPYKGQKITVSFQNHSRFDNYYNTYTYLDNVRLEP